MESSYEKRLRSGTERRIKTFHRIKKKKTRKARHALEVKLGRTPTFTKVRKARKVDLSKIINPPVSPQELDLTKAGKLKRGTVEQPPRRNPRRRFSMKALYKALAIVERDVDKVPIMEHFVRRAYDSDQVLKALMGKVLPDLKSIDAQITQKSPYKLVLDIGKTVPQLAEATEQDLLDEDWDN